MKLIIFGFIAMAVPLAMCYDEKFDQIDVDKIIADEKAFNSYTMCLLDKGPCSLEHSDEFRKLLPEVIATACAKCTPIQKVSVRKAVKALGEKRPDDLKQIQEKYDPKGEYQKEFTAFVMATN